MREGFQTGRAVFRLMDFARAEAVQQRAQDAPHMRVVVDDEKTQAVEIDADHGAPRPRAAVARYRPTEATGAALTKGLASGLSAGGGRPQPRLFPGRRC